MKLPIDVFTEWAKDGRDERMARGHADSVNSMLYFALEGQVDPFTFIDGTFFISTCMDSISLKFCPQEWMALNK